MIEPRTKIHCTVGPACRDPETLRRMVDAGADVFRINGAHADAAEIKAWVALVREAEAVAGRPVGILVDLPGPKIRVGELSGDEPVLLAAGATVRFDAGRTPGDAGRIPLRAMPFFADLERGVHAVFGDGRGRLEVVVPGQDGVTLKVLEGGEIRPGMGVHFPGVSLPTSVPTKKDRALLEAAVHAGADMISQSFVRNADDVARLQELMVTLGAKGTLAIAKVERLDAIRHLDAILARADGILIGRGDLGMDAGVEAVPSLQRRILEAGRRFGRPVVVATEMLESMTRTTRPTRAEASDVAGAVFEAADGVLLSAETAIGAHPVLVVETLARLLCAAEEDPTAPYAGERVLPLLASRAGRPDQHVVHAAVELASETDAEAIVVFTRQGSSALRLSKERPRARVYAFAPNAEVRRRLTLAWGVRPRDLPAGRTTDEVIAAVESRLREAGGLAPGARVVLVMGSMEDPAGATTLIRLISM